MFNQQEFKDWYNNFVQRFEGFSPHFFDFWYTNIEKNHSNIRKLINGTEIKKVFSFKNESNDVTASIFEKMNEILEIIPEYLNDNCLDKQVFLNGTVPKGTHDSVKLSKHIINYAESKGISRLYVEGFLAELGVLWEKQKVSDISVEMILSTEPQAFAMLGHYPTDLDSCFRQNGQSQEDKYLFAQSNETFVILFRIKGESEISARCLGFLREPDSFNIINYYFKPTFKESDAIFSLKSLFESIINNKIFIQENIVDCDKNLFYKNKYFNFTFSGKTQKDIAYFAPNLIMIKRFPCSSCGKSLTKANFLQQINNEFYCRFCYEIKNEKST